VFELKAELQFYFQENSRPDFAKCSEDKEWLEKLAYIEDIFRHMNQLNKSLQGPGENILSSSDKIYGIKRKLNFGKNHVVKRNLEMFPLLLGLESEEGYHEFSSHIENKCGKKLNIIFPPFQHKCITGRGTFAPNHLLSPRI
jgi:hypothetical protein